ncbi:unnamed protein product [Polarella glacialis]|uniref:Uncharacterized protein n=2 Tax=Polarella glacialis TaxID=89957 RepID=A0A813D230_POLGL|nr:unnamed protein product [Polarella glacialis]
MAWMPGIGRGRAGLASVVFEGEVFILGGHDGHMPVKTMESFCPGKEDGDRGEWQELPPMLARRAYPTASLLNNKVYAVGGSADGRTLSTFEVYDVDKKAWDMWFTKPPLQTKRTLHATAVAEGKLYVTGGYDGIRDLKTVEVYDPRTNHWSHSTDAMTFSRSYHSLVTCAGSIYAIGGQDRTPDGDQPRAHVSVEAFELYCERWLPAPDLTVGRIGASAVVLADADGHEFIYLSGGSDGETMLSSVERFCPKIGIWEKVPPMALPRLGHTSAVVGGRLYVIGGFDGKVPLDTFECFDPQAWSWSAPLKMGVVREELPALPDGAAF